MSRTVTVQANKLSLGDKLLSQAPGHDARTIVKVGRVVGLEVMPRPFDEHPRVKVTTTYGVNVVQWDDPIGVCEEDE